MNIATFLFQSVVFMKGSLVMFQISMTLLTVLILDDYGLFAYPNEHMPPDILFDIEGVRDSEERISQ